MLSAVFSEVMTAVKQ